MPKLCKEGIKMEKEQTRILQLKEKIRKTKKSLEAYSRVMNISKQDLNYLEIELSILETGGTIKDVQAWKDKNHSE
jgi:hypothetical protein